MNLAAFRIIRIKKSQVKAGRTAYLNSALLCHVLELSLSSVSVALKLWFSLSFSILSALPLSLSKKYYPNSKIHKEFPSPQGCQWNWCLEVPRSTFRVLVMSVITLSCLPKPSFGGEGDGRTSQYHPITHGLSMVPTCGGIRV